ncbi:fungal-specific transcription factor domain-containing protein [Coprinopsis sp. MPI-PUGE-AT-0042]|nr:fungal-specific transcription factor domain-containing protein [Coprinopsis sp. MPI-PUGE-AT-0042]
MAASIPAASEEAPRHSIVEYRANGEISRMRNHKGNAPQLPQNKYCSLCPAKFTRTTHLNRHFRSHTNERQHRCDVCQAEFTRSDLLTRHKRTCGDARNSQRSRRKSCQSCAESKVKCNLQQPCGKCVARGRECVFINDPEASRSRKASGKNSRPSPSNSEVKSETSDASFSQYASGPSSLYQRASGSQSPYATVGGFPSPGVNAMPSPLQSLHPSPVIPNQMDAGGHVPFSLGAYSSNSSSTTSSSRPASRLEAFDIVPNLANLTFVEDLGTNSQLDDFFPLGSESGSSYHHLNGYGGSSPGQQHHQSSGLVSGLIDTSEARNSAIGNEDSFSTHRAAATSSSTSSSHGPTYGAPGSDHGSNSIYNSSTTSTSSHGPGANAEDLDPYLSTFFSTFSPQLPIVHRPTWKPAGTHPMLVNAMQVCGAVYLRSDEAVTFVRRTLVYLKDNLVSEFSKPESTPRDRFSLVIAVALLQSLGLLWRQADQSASTKAFHGVLASMIRKLGLVKILNEWTPPDLSNPYALDTAWKDWARYETVKRVVSLAYVQDCSNCVFYATNPLLPSMESEIKLPCDEALWTASSAKEWYHALRTPSVYGAGPRRLQPISIQQALSSLDLPVPMDMQTRLSPFSNFVVIHTILRDVFAAYFDRPSGSAESTSRRPSTEYALHNWYQVWSHSSEGPRGRDSDDAFVSSPIPLYWLTRYALAAIQEGALDPRPAVSEMAAQDRCRLLASWLNRIKDYLDKGYPLPQRVQDLGGISSAVYASQQLYLPEASHGGYL